jgi:hypothetical protein
MNISPIPIRCDNGVDVLVYRYGPHTEVDANTVAAALGLTLDSLPWGTSEFVGDDAMTSPAVCELHHLRSCGQPGTTEIADFITEVLAELSNEHTTQPRTVATHDRVADAPPADVSTAHTWSVREASMLLRRDPALGSLSIAMTFAAIRYVLGWVERENAWTWIPTADGTRAGNVVRDVAWRRPIREPYPQVRITETGMRRLFTELGGVGTLELTASEQPALLEEHR